MLPRGPRTPKSWQTYRYLQHPKEYVRRLVAKYGPASRFRMLQGSGLMVSTPDLAREVFAMDPASYSTVPAIAELFGVRSVISTFGDEHKRQRKLLNPRFHGQRMKTFFSTMHRVVEAHIDGWKPGAELKMGDAATEITLHIILETVFGAKASLDRTRAHAVLEEVGKAFVPTLLAFPKMGRKIFPVWRRFDRARAMFDTWVDEIIAERRASNELGDDILGVLLEARYEDGSPIGDVEMRDHLLTLLAAGHETTAVALSWGIGHLASHPDVLARLRRELAASDGTPEAMTKLPYLAAVGAEALRIEPIVTDVARICRVPVKVGEWTVPAGELVAVMVGGILGDATIYEEPDAFRPERFLDKKPAANEFLPFGGGSRRCLGAAFAEAELAIAIGTIARRWNVELTDPRPERAVRRNITMGPKRGIPIRVVGAA